MKRLLLLLLCALTYSIGSAQVIYKEFYSYKMDEDRKLKIQLPRNYEENVDKHYPIVLVLDGDYLFEPVAGNVDYFSYWEDMPESIVVGIMQGDSRYDDCYYDNNSSMPIDSGADFFEFIGLELMPYLDKEFRTAQFVIGVGHDFTANFLNYYLFKDPVLFNGYIMLSPDYAPQLSGKIVDRIPHIKQKVFYYLATGTDDIRGLYEASSVMSRQLEPLNSDKFSFYFDDFQGATHYSLVSKGIPNALEKIFSVYRPISKKEFDEVLMKTEKPLYDYLMDKYSVIEDLFGIKDKVRTNDFLAIGAAAEKRKHWEVLEDIGKLAKKQYPKLALGDYYLGRYYEETGNDRKAIQTYRSAFNKEEIDFITADLLLDRADDINDKRKN